jgi:pilus assembly protein CpaB
MKKWNPVLTVTLAIVIALAGSILAYRIAKKQTAAPQPIVVKSAETVDIAVAVVSLPWGAKILPEMITMKPYLKDSLPPGSFNDSEKLINRVVISPVKLDEPILESRLGGEGSNGGVGSIVTPGKRAIAVKGNKVIGLSGLIKPSDRVDVLVTIEKDTGNKNTITKLVLENILVLATGTKLEQNDKGDPLPIDVYTLEVTPEEGEKLALASTEGELQFALRNETDVEKIITEGATVSQLLNSLSKPYQKPKKKKTAYRAPVSVKEIRGTTVSYKKF